MNRLLVLVVACSVNCRYPEHSAQPKTEKATRPPVRITQFYATQPMAPSGESTTLCYGVDNAAVVRIDPPVERLGPTLARCFTVSPQKTTTYTLTAEDEQGKTSSQSVTVTVGDPLPKFTDLSISDQEVSPGEVIAFCFKANNAVNVQGRPGYFRGGGSPRSDCLVDTPRQTTSYRITIKNASGQADHANITVKVR